MERIAFEYRKDEPFRVVKDGCVGTIRCMEGGGVSKYIMEVKVIGQMDNTIDHTFESANRVYDKNGLAPTINTCGGGGLQPKVIDEVKELGFMDNVNTENIIIGGEQEHQAVKKDGVCTTLTSSKGTGGGYVPMVLTEVEALNAMPDGTCRTIKSQYGNTSSANFMYSSTYGATGAIETVRIKQATKDGYIECKVGGVADLSFPDSTTRRGRVQDGGDVCPTLMAGEQDICRIEKKCISTKGKENDVASTILSGYERSNMTGFNADNGVLEINSREEAYINELIESGALENPGIYSYDGYNNKVNDTGVIGTVVPQNSRWGMTNGHKVIDTTVEYRIRKLTPRECYRLMAVPEESIDKMLEVNSNTQCYKQAGNSIVVNCLIAIFSQMGIQSIPRWNEGLNEKYK